MIDDARHACVCCGNISGYPTDTGQKNAVEGKSVIVELCVAYAGADLVAVRHEGVAVLIRLGVAAENRADNRRTIFGDIAFKAIRIPAI